MTTNLTRDDVLVDAIIAVLAVVAWVVSSYAETSELVFSPTWTLAGFVLATGLLLLRAFTGVGRRLRPRSVEVVLGNALVFVVLVLLVLAAWRAIAAAGIVVSVGSEWHSLLLGPALSLPLEVLVYRRG